MINDASTQIDQRKIEDHIDHTPALQQVYPGDKEYNAQEGREPHREVGDWHAFKLKEASTMNNTAGGTYIYNGIGRKAYATMPGIKKYQESTYESGNGRIIIFL
jgi:hypothetical protein